MADTTNFWGLHLTEGLPCTQKIAAPFKVSAAVLDTSSCKQDSGVISVLFKENNTETIIANLSNKKNILQVPLDLQFSSGSVVCFYLKGGSGDVYLSGYHHENDEFDDELEMQESEEESEAEMNGHVVPQREKKRKTPDDYKVETNAKKVKVEIKKEESPKISKNQKKRERKRRHQEANRSMEKESKEEFNKGHEKTKKKAIKPALDENFKLEDIVKGASFVDEDSSDGDFEGVEDEEEEDSDVEGEDEEMDAAEETLDLDEEDSDEEESDEEESDEEEEEESDEEDDEMKKGDAKSKLKGNTPTSAGRTPMVKKAKGDEAMSSPNLKKTPQQKPKTPVTGKDKHETPKTKTQVKTPKSEIKKVIKTGGVVCEDLEIGSGADAKNGKMVSVYYEGKLKNGKGFDKVKSGPCFKFRLGGNEVIKAWDVGIAGMKVGGRRRITAPPSMAYGKKGAPPDIPANSILIFDVKLKAIS